MARALAALLVIFMVTAPTLGQQTGLTDAQIRTAEVEVPRLVELMELEPGMTVADVGAGFGAWSIRFARWLGPGGRLYATDLGAAQLASLRRTMEQERLTSVAVIEGAATATNLPAACCDAVLVRDAYHHFTQPQEMIRSLAASLKPGGRLVIIDFLPRSGSEVPAGVPADRRGHGVPIEIVEREVGAVLRHVRTIPDWSTSGNPLYLVLFRKP